MTVADRIFYCRNRLVDPAIALEDLAAWLAEHDGLMVGAEYITELEGLYVSDERLQMWFRRGVEDGQVLKSLEMTARRG